jgi:hypothetical protein
VCQVSIVGKSEFSRRSQSYKSGGCKNSGNKKTKTKGSTAGSPLLVTFLAKQKSD